MGGPGSVGKWRFVSFYSAQSVQISNEPEFRVNASDASTISPNDAIVNST